jgi:hypothetical protein
MFHTRRSILIAPAVCLACGLLLFVGQESSPPVEARVLEAEGKLQWYRGNLHTHSLWSDGDDYLEMIAKWYKQKDYDFLCFTDHNVLANRERWTDVLKNKGGQKAYDKLKASMPKDWVEERTVDGRLEVRLKRFDEVNEQFAEPGKFLLIQGEEVTDRFRNLPVHINMTNVTELIPPLHGDSVYEVMQNNVGRAVAQRERTKKPLLVHLNHPNFGYGVTAEDLMRVRGENFFEVYNGHPGVRNSGDAKHASTERIWDIILTRRLAELEMPMMYGLATDDGHNYHKIPSRGSEPGRGWVMVLSDELSPAALIGAMERGRFYASSGVSLKKVVSTPAGLHVDVKVAAGVTYQITFIGTRKGYDPKSKPVLDNNGKPMNATQIYSDDIGEVFKTVEGPTGAYEFTGDELYVRALVSSSKKHPNPSEVGEVERAWVQPTVGPGVPKSESK